MATRSTIEWTDTTWNPVSGCNKISPGCKHCYAERMAMRLQSMGNPRYAHGFQVTLHDDLVELPLKWKAPRRVFVNSMSDLFHDAVPATFISRVFAAMERADQHQFQILTKRADRLAELSSALPWPKNVWMGVSVETVKYYSRIHCLRQVPAQVRFLSLEPLLGPLPDLPLDGIHWVIVGGESGPGCRPMDAEWVRNIRCQCTEVGVAFFFKQWGGVWKKRAGRELDDRTWDEMPIELAV